MASDRLIELSPHTFCFHAQVDFFWRETFQKLLPKWPVESFAQESGVAHLAFSRDQLTGEDSSIGKAPLDRAFHGGGEAEEAQAHPSDVLWLH